MSHIISAFTNLNTKEYLNYFSKIATFEESESQAILGSVTDCLSVMWTSNVNDHISGTVDRATLNAPCLVHQHDIFFQGIFDKDYEIDRALPNMETSGASWVRSILFGVSLLDHSGIPGIVSQSSIKEFGGKKYSFDLFGVLPEGKVVFLHSGKVSDVCSLKPETIRARASLSSSGSPQVLGIFLEVPTAFIFDSLEEVVAYGALGKFEQKQYLPEFILDCARDLLGGATKDESLIYKSRLSKAFDQRNEQEPSRVS